MLFHFILANGHPSYNNLSLMLFLDPQAKVLNKIKTMIYHPSAFLAFNIWEFKQIATATSATAVVDAVSWGEYARSSPNFKRGSCSLAYLLAFFAIIFQQQNSMVGQVRKRPI